MINKLKLVIAGVNRCLSIASAARLHLRVSTEQAPSDQGNPASNNHDWANELNEGQQP